MSLALHLTKQCHSGDEESLFFKGANTVTAAEVLCTCMHMYELDWRLNLLADPKDVVLRQEKSWLAAIC